MKKTEKLPDGVLWKEAKEYSKKFAIRDKPVQSEIAMNDAQDHYYRGMIVIRDMIEQQNNEFLSIIKDCKKKVDTEVPFGKEDAYDAIINEIDKNLKKSIQVGDITEKGIVDTIGNCANCGVEFHIHKEVFEKDELLSNLILKAIKISEIDSYGRKMVRLDKLQELLTNEILK